MMAPPKLLLDLLDVPAPSGFERPAAEVWSSAAASFAETGSDRLGGRFARVNPQHEPIVAVCGHLDEIGLIVRSVDKHGLVKFGPIGGWEVAVLAGQRVTIATKDGAVAGTVGQLAPHQVAEERRDKRLKYEDLWVDIGASGPDEANGLVRPGDPVVLEAKPHVFPNGRVMTRAADNRLGCFVALEVARRCEGMACQVVAVATGTEETDGAGAGAMAAGLRPDVACVIDVTPTSDVPGEHDEETVLGGGPVITIGGFSTPGLAREVIAAAHGAGIEIQVNAAGGPTWTDADAVIRAADGVPTVVVSIPTRYLHSPGELFDMADVMATIELLVAWIEQSWQNRSA